MNFAEKREHTGHLSQLFEVKEYRLLGGKSEGMRAVDVDNGSGLAATILVDRGMDLGRVSFRGINMSFISPCGYVAPEYYQPMGTYWLQSFTAGMMTTCGLTNIGGAGEDHGEILGLHGKIANIPAEQFCARVTETKESAEVVMEGLLRHSEPFKENLLLTRKITIKYGVNQICIHDTIENIGYRTVPYMMLYHCNLGYPLLDERSEIMIPSHKVTAKDDHAETGIDRFNQTEIPTGDYAEMCYFHEMKKDPNGFSAAAVYNPGNEVGLCLRFSADTLDYFTEWKMMAKGDYVLGLEPCNAPLSGRAAAREEGRLKFLAPGEKTENKLCFEFFGAEDRNRIKNELSALI